MIIDVLARVKGSPSPGGSVALTDDGLGQGGPMRRRSARVPAPRASFAGFRFSPEVIMVAVRWYLRYGLSYRDVEELFATPDERDAYQEVDTVRFLLERSAG